VIPQAELSYPRLLQKSWPIILANSAVPLLGLSDTFIMGNFGSIAEIGAIALGATIFSIIYWSFGFSRMTTSGFIAQASGANDQVEIRANLARSLIIALTIGIVLIILQLPINFLIILALSASQEVESATSNYFLIRIWGAPATLAMFVATGVLIGLGKSYLLLIIQLFLNLLNILLDILFAVVLDWGVEGIAIGTVISEWCAIAFSAKIIFSLMKKNKKSKEKSNVYFPRILMFLFEPYCWYCLFIGSIIKVPSSVMKFWQQTSFYCNSYPLAHSSWMVMPLSQNRLLANQSD